MLQTIALVVHVFLAIGVIGLVLIQHGKGAEAGAAFGAGASATVFGSRGSGSFLTRMTTLFALAFFCTSMLLFFLAAKHTNTGIGSVTDGVDVPSVQQQTDTPATDSGEQSDVPATDVPAPAGDNAATDVPVVPGAESASESDVPATPKSE